MCLKVTSTEPNAEEWVERYKIVCITTKGIQSFLYAYKWKAGVNEANQAPKIVTELGTIVVNEAIHVLVSEEEAKEMLVLLHEYYGDKSKSIMKVFCNRKDFVASGYCYLYEKHFLSEAYGQVTLKQEDYDTCRDARDSLVVPKVAL